MALYMRDMGPPSLLLNFRDSFIFPPRLTFSRSGTATYRDRQLATVTAAANTPRVGYHATNDALGRGLVMTTGEICTLSDVTWLKAGVGTMLWVGTLSSVAVNSILWGLHDTTGNEVIRLRMNGTNAGELSLTVVDGAATTIDDVTSSMVPETRYAIAVAWSGTDFFTTINDNDLKHSTLSSGGIPTPTTFQVMSPSSGGGLAGVAAQGVCELIAHWPECLDRTQMWGLTRTRT